MDQAVAQSGHRWLAYASIAVGTFGFLTFFSMSYLWFVSWAIGVAGGLLAYGSFRAHRSLVAIGGLAVNAALMTLFVWVGIGSL